MSSLTHGLDLSTRHFWRVVGRPVDIEDEHRWLDSPYTARGGSGDDWLREFERSGQIRLPDARDGLVESMTGLDGPEFTAGRLDPRIRYFYEHTAAWGMEVWSQWNALFAPAGELIARAWGRRVQQLALPVEPLSVSRGTSSVVRVVEHDGTRAGAAWIRNLRGDGSRVYSGYYRLGHYRDSNSRTYTSSFRWKTAVFRCTWLLETMSTALSGSSHGLAHSAATALMQ